MMSYLFSARTLRRLLPGVALAAATSCSSSPPTAPMGDAFSLGIGDRASIAGTPLVLTFQRLVEDSRCAPDVTCVWSGNAAIEVDARIVGGHQAVLLNTHVGPREAVVGPFRITLVAFTPPPPSNVRVGEGYYRATLRVARADGPVCTQEARASLSVTVLDSLEGPATFTNLRLTAIDGAFADSAFHETYPNATFSGPVPLVWERAGTYRVTVTADGYQPWVEPAVIVERDACHVITVPLTARLAR